MLKFAERPSSDLPPWSTWKVLGVTCVIALLIFAFTHGSLVDRLGHEYPTVAFLAAWAIGLLSYHQDAKHQDPWWAILSQIPSVCCLMAILVFGFTHGSWRNFLIAPLLAFLHIELSRRWWIRPGSWW